MVLTMTEDDVCYLSATQLLQLFQAKALSPLELVQAQIARFEQVNPTVNAIVMNYFDEALVEAKKAEQAYLTKTNRALEGLTVGVKDEQNILGKITTNGSRMMLENMAKYSDPICDRLVQAGAIVHARTATPELSCNYCTWSNLWGVTRNPWNLNYSAGGSSGGSGAALAAGMTTLATGSDIGGSVRMPASQNSVVGYKPPRGRVPKYPPWNLVHYYTDGPMARNVSDVILMENVISGPHSIDPASAMPKHDLPLQYEGLEGMRVAVCVSMGGKSIDEDVRRNTLAVGHTVKALGGSVSEVELGWNEAEANNVFNVYFNFLAAAFIERKLGPQPDFENLANSYVKQFFIKGRTITRDQYIDGLYYEAHMQKVIRELFSDFDVLICPTLSVASVPADFDLSTDKFLVNGVEEPTVPGPGMTQYFNTLSRCPVLSIPSGFDRNGVPTGVQIVGSAYDEDIVFRTAMAIEGAGVKPYSTESRPGISQMTSDLRASLGAKSPFGKCFNG